MSSIPPDIYQQVREISISLTNATEAGDEILVQFHYQQLLDFFHQQNESGNAHPFITETLADYTEDASDAVKYYELALAQCRKNPEEPAYTKQISLAERLLELKQVERAKTLLQQGRAEARCRNDAFWAHTADDLLAEI